MAVTAGDRALRIQDVAQRTGMSRSWFYVQVAAGAFPRPFKLGLHASAWLESEVNEWLAGRAATRETGVPA